MIRKWILLTCFVLSSCASTPSRTKSAQTPPPPRPELPAPVIAPRQPIPHAPAENHFAAGQKAFQAKDFSRSFDLFVSAAEGWKGTAKELEAQFWAARAAVRLARWSETLSLTEQLLKYPNWINTQRAELMNYRIRSFEAVGDHPRLLETLQAGLQDPTLIQEYESYRLKALETVETRMHQGELETLLDSRSPDTLRASAAYRLGEIAVEARDLSSAQAYFKRAQSLGKDSETGRRATEVLAQLEALSRVEPKTIGVVLPLTGRHSGIAQKTLRGIQMGLGLYGKNISSFKVAVVDDEGNPDRARQGVERLVREDNVIAIIGSLMSRTAPAVASKSAELGVPSLALSQKSGITELGATVHRNSLTSEMQVRWLVKQAMEELGHRRFAIMYPNDAYGVEFANIFWDEVLARGGQITAAQTYSTKETDFRYVVQRLVGTYYPEARGEELRLRMKEQKDNPRTRSVRKETPESLLPPIVDFDSVFIPDSVKAMGQIAAMLAFNDVKGVKLLGTNLWNVPSDQLQKRAGNWSRDLLFVDSFVASDNAFQSSGFVRDYKAVFNEEPGIFELQGYDSALILRQLISQGYSSRESLNKALGSLKDVPGALSKLSMGPEREILRPLVALTLENGQIVPFRKKTAP